MKFEKHDLSNGMKIPVAAMQISGFGAHEATEYYTLKDTVAVLKKQMTASGVSIITIAHTSI